MTNKAKAKGRAGQKERSKKAGTPKGTPRGKPWLSLLEDDENPHKLFRGFAGASSPHVSSPRDLNVMLRNVPISFVSAGSNTPAASDPEPSSRNVKRANKVEVEEDDDDDDDVIDFDEEFDDEGLQTNIVMEIDELEVPQGAMAHMHITTEGDNGKSDADMTYVEVRGTAPQDPMPHQLPIPEQQAAEPEALSFIIDTEGDPTLADGMYMTMKNKTARRPSPAPSDSSEEIVVFSGRNKTRVINDPVIHPLAKAQSKSRSQPQVTDDLPAALQQPSTMTQRTATGWAAPPAKIEDEVEPWKPAPAEPYWRKSRSRRDASPSTAEFKAIENTLARKSRDSSQDNTRKIQCAEQTIASLQAEWKLTKQQEKQAKAPLNKEKIMLETRTQSRRNKRGRKKINRQLRAEPVLDNEGDDSEAAYEDYMANLAAQLDGEDDTSIKALASLARSELISGPSLVVNGKEVDDDELLDSNLEIDRGDESSADSDIIGQDHDSISGDDVPLAYSDLDSSDLEEELEYDEQEQWEDEEDLRKRRMERMTDEQVARLLAKQLEMGIDCDELILDDGFCASDDDLDGIGDLEEARAGLDQLLDSSFGKVTKKPTKGKRTARGDDSFPDASMLADTIEQYGENGFDIMDLDRSSLRTTKKGRKGKLPPELEALSDEELKAEMRNQWEGDRSKKRLRKVERAELRAQGLLGAMGKKGKADLSEKYLEGMNMQQIRDELRIFLMNDGQQTRPFPPMNTEDRKALHEIANAFKLKSKSVGSGNSRFPVLYKTKRTVDFSDARFNRVMLASSRGFLSNNSGRPNKFKKGKAGTGGGFNAAAVSLRHGEEVGAGAPEIGKDNFGHRLMEKMGWTKGTALGKDGEGMLLPVSQIMRSGKAGLG
ncbi:Hypothetical protein R9X50_00083300 [Acrodontium crateriforme]|uniref:Protein SQS1 n=1 Tax=Acrodontium crateriforme TaxID=150365 RepID=A0AAQ3R7J8_9PEZI|nr:Hypothetical protein R9X50_00083300 [Acrodontium crateriforme]